MDCHRLRLESYNDYHKMKEKGGRDRQSRPSQFEEIPTSHASESAFIFRFT